MHKKMTTVLLTSLLSVGASCLAATPATATSHLGLGEDATEAVVEFTRDLTTAATTDAAAARALADYNVLTKDEQERFVAMINGDEPLTDADIAVEEGTQSVSQTDTGSGAAHFPDSPVG